MNNSIQKFEEGEFESPEKNTQGGIPNGNGDEIKREENNNGLGELNSSTEAAEPTAGGSKCASASSPEERKAAIKKAHDLLVSIGIGTGAPCEDCDDDYAPRPPITSDTYDAPDSPVKTKGGKSKVTHPNEHPKPVNKCGDGCDGTAVKPEEDEEDDSVVKGEEHIPTWAEIRKGAQKRPGANGGVSPSGKKLSPAEERAEADAKSKKAQEKKFEDQKASEFGDVTGNYAHTKQIVDRLKARYGGKTTKGEEHIPTWAEIRKAQVQTRLDSTIGDAGYTGTLGSAFELREPELEDIHSAEDQIAQRERTLAAQPDSPTAQKYYNDTIGKLMAKLAAAKETRRNTVNSMAADPEKLAEAQARNKAVAGELDALNGQ